MKWQKKLNKGDHKHMRENNMRTVADMRENRRLQNEIRASVPDSREVCYECKSVVIKLGIE